MARDVATAQMIDLATGLDVQFSAFVQANGGEYDNTAQNAFMIFINGDATGKTVTISSTKTISPQEVAMPAKTFTVPATNDAFIIPVLTNQWWGQPSSVNSVYVDIDSDTSVTWAVAYFE